MLICLLPMQFLLKQVLLIGSSLVYSPCVFALCVLNLHIITPYFSIRTGHRISSVVTVEADFTAVLHCDLSRRPPLEPVLPAR